MRAPSRIFAPSHCLLSHSKNSCLDGWLSASKGILSPPNPKFACNLSRDSTQTRPLPRLASKSNYNGRCNRSIKLKGLRMRLPMLIPRYRHSPNHHQTDENPRLPNQQHRQLRQSLHVIWSAIEKYHTYQGENTLFVKTTGAEKSFMIVVLSKLMEGKVTFVVLVQVKEQVWITLQCVTAESKFWGNHPDSAYWIKTNLWLEYGAKPKTIKIN